MYNQDYFKGWYFKCNNKNKTIAFILAFHQSNHEKTASLQIITDTHGRNTPAYQRESHPYGHTDQYAQHSE